MVSSPDLLNVRSEKKSDRFASTHVSHVSHVATRVTRGHTCAHVCGAKLGPFPGGGSSDYPEKK